MGKNKQYSRGQKVAVKMGTSGFETSEDMCFTSHNNNNNNDDNNDDNNNNNNNGVLSLPIPKSGKAIAPPPPFSSTSSSSSPPPQQEEESDQTTTAASATNKNEDHHHDDNIFISAQQERDLTRQECVKIYDIRWQNVLSAFTMNTIGVDHQDNMNATYFQQQPQQQDYDEGEESENTNNNNNNNTNSSYHQRTFSNFGYEEYERLRLRLEKVTGCLVLPIGSAALGLARATPNCLQHPGYEVFRQAQEQVDDGKVCFNFQKYSDKTHMRASSWDFLIVPGQTGSTSTSANDNDDNNNKINNTNFSLDKVEAQISSILSAELDHLDYSSFDARKKPQRDKNEYQKAFEIFEKGIVKINREELFVPAIKQKDLMNPDYARLDVKTNNLSGLVRRGKLNLTGVCRVLIAKEGEWAEHPSLSAAILLDYIREYPNLLAVMNLVRYWAVTHGGSWSTRDLPPRQLFMKLKQSVASARAKGNRMVVDGEVNWRFFAFAKTYWNWNSSTAREENSSHSKLNFTQANKKPRGGAGVGSTTSGATAPNGGGGAGAGENVVYNIGGLHPHLLDHLVLCIMLKTGHIRVLDSLKTKKKILLAVNKYVNHIREGGFLGEVTRLVDGVSLVMENDEEEVEGEKEPQQKGGKQNNNKQKQPKKEEEGEGEGGEGGGKKPTGKGNDILGMVRSFFSYFADDKNNLAFTELALPPGSEAERKWKEEKLEAQQNKQPVFCAPANNIEFNLAAHLDILFVNVLRHLSKITLLHMNAPVDDDVLRAMIHTWNVEDPTQSSAFQFQGIFSDRMVRQHHQEQQEQQDEKEKQQQQQQQQQQQRRNAQLLSMIHHKESAADVTIDWFSKLSQGERAGGGRGGSQQEQNYQQQQQQQNNHQNHQRGNGGFQAYWAQRHYDANRLTFTEDPAIVVSSSSSGPNSPSSSTPEKSNYNNNENEVVDPVLQISCQDRVASFKKTDEPGFALFCHPQAVIEAHRTEYCDLCCCRVSQHQFNAKKSGGQHLCNNCSSREVIEARKAAAEEGEVFQDSKTGLSSRAVKLSPMYHAANWSEVTQKDASVDYTFTPQKGGTGCPTYFENKQNDSLNRVVNSDYSNSNNNRRGGRGPRNNNNNYHQQEPYQQQQQPPQPQAWNTAPSNVTTTTTRQQNSSYAQPQQQYQQPQHQQQQNHHQNQPRDEEDVNPHGMCPKCNRKFSYLKGESLTKICIRCSKYVTVNREIYKNNTENTSTSGSTSGAGAGGEASYDVNTDGCCPNCGGPASYLKGKSLKDLCMKCDS